MDFNNVNPSLMKLAELLKMASPTPSHGYTISEAGPEIVTAPGVYFPSEKGEVIPLQSRKEGGSVSPNSNDTEKEKLGILREIISQVKPRQGMESRQFGGPVSPDGQPSLIDQIEKSKYDIFKAAMSVLKPQPQKSIGPSSPTSPSLPGLPKPITTSSYGIMPEAMKPNEGEALWQKKEKGFDAGVLDLTSRQYGGVVDPDLEELKKRKQWEIPGYSERRLEEVRNILGPSVLGVQPGFQKSYYEEHPEEKLMDEETTRMKTLTDAIIKSIKDEETRQQGYGTGFGPTPMQRRLGLERKEPSQIPELLQGLKGLTPTSRERTTGTTPHLVQTSSGQYAWAYPPSKTSPAGNVFPVGISAPEKTEPATEDKRKYMVSKKAEYISKGMSESEAEKKAYEDAMTLGPLAYGEQRYKMMMDVPMSVYDTNTGNVALKTRDEINQANKENSSKNLGDRFVGAELATKLRSKRATFDEIEYASTTVRKALGGLKKDFDPVSRAQFSKVLQSPNERSSFDAFLRSTAGTTLSDDQVEFLTSVINLRESAFALRNVMGMGQGSDMLRAAIAAAIPGAGTFSKKHALSTLVKFDKQVEILKSGIPGIGGEKTQKGVSTGRKMKLSTGEEIIVED